MLAGRDLTRDMAPQPEPRTTTRGLAEGGRSGGVAVPSVPTRGAAGASASAWWGGRGREAMGGEREGGATPQRGLRRRWLCPARPWIIAAAQRLTAPSGPKEDGNTYWLQSDHRPRARPRLSEIVTPTIRDPGPSLVRGSSELNSTRPLSSTTSFPSDSPASQSMRDDAARERTRASRGGGRRRPTQPSAWSPPLPSGWGGQPHLCWLAYFQAERDTD